MPSIRKKSFAAEQLARQKKKNPWPWIIAGIAVAVVVLGIGYALLSRHQVEVKPVTEETAPPAEKITSIAVLPFVNMSTDPEQVPFCDGIADAIISALTHVGDLRVIARSSSFAFRGDAVNIRAVGDTLDADWVLEGSVQKAGNELRITAQLINAQDLSHLFSNVYEKELKDVFAIQEEIAQSVVDSLKIKLLDSERTAIEKRYTENIEAFNLYSQGRFHWYKRNYEGYMRALECYEKALELDSNYALAYTGIADTYMTLSGYAFMPPEEAIRQAKKAVKRALEIDDMLAEAHVSSAKVILSYNWDDWARCENEFKRAIELKPGYALAHHWYSDYLRAMGRLDEALTEIKNALEIDPISPIQYTNLANVYMYLGDYDEALEQCHKGLEINSHFFPLYSFIGDIELEKRNFKNAIQSYQKSLDLTEGYDYAEGALGCAYGLSGDRDKAEKILASLIERIDREYISPISIAAVYFGLGENDRGFDWLERAYNERTSWLPFYLMHYKFSPLWQHLSQDPHFIALVKKMNLPY